MAGEALFHFPRMWAQRNEERVTVFANGHVYDKRERRTSVRQLIQVMRDDKARRGQDV